MLDDKFFVRYEKMIGVNADGKQKPIFWAPGLPGRAEWILPLAYSLKEDFPSYAFDSPEYNENHSIESTATAYIKLMKNIQGNGPYFLGGYSFGGAVIYEMAKQIHKLGEEVSHIIFLDCYAPYSNLLSQIFNQIDTKRMTVLITNVIGVYWEVKQTLNLDMLNKVEENNYIEFMIYYLFYHSNHPFLKESEFVKFLRHCFLDGLRNYSVLKNYHPSKYDEDLKIILLQSKNGFTGKNGSLATRLFNPPIHVNESYLNGWDKLLSSPIKSIFLPCDHFELIIEPNIGDIVKILYTEVYGHRS